MAFTAVAAIASGSAAITAATVLAAVAEIGTVLSVVGAVTGSKTLTKIGATMGVVGAIGSLATGALSGGLAADGVTKTAGESLSKAALDGTDSFGANSMADAFKVGDVPAAAGVGDGGAVQATDLPSLTTSPTAQAPAVQTVAAPGATPAAAAPTPTPTPSAVAGADPNAVTGGAEKARNLGPTGPTGPTSPFDAGKEALNDQYWTGARSPANNASKSFGAYFKDLTDFASANKDLVSGVAKFGLGAMKGAADGQYNQARIDLARQQAANGNSVASTAPRTAGIIQGAITA